MSFSQLRNITIIIISPVWTLASRTILLLACRSWAFTCKPRLVNLLRSCYPAFSWSSSFPPVIDSFIHDLFRHTMIIHTLYTTQPADPRRLDKSANVSMAQDRSYLNQEIYMNLNHCSTVRISVYISNLWNGYGVVSYLHIKQHAWRDGLMDEWIVTKSVTILTTPFRTNYTFLQFQLHGMPSSSNIYTVHDGEK